MRALNSSCWSSSSLSYLSVSATSSSIDASWCTALCRFDSRFDIRRVLSSSSISRSRLKLSSSSRASGGRLFRSIAPSISFKLESSTSRSFSATVDCAVLFLGSLINSLSLFFSVSAISFNSNPFFVISSSSLSKSNSRPSPSSASWPISLLTSFSSAFATPAASIIFSTISATPSISLQVFSFSLANAVTDLATSSFRSPTITSSAWMRVNNKSTGIDLPTGGSRVMSRTGTLTVILPSSFVDNSSSSVRSSTNITSSSSSSSSCSFSPASFRTLACPSKKFGSSSLSSMGFFFTSFFAFFSSFSTGTNTSNTPTTATSPNTLSALAFRSKNRSSSSFILISSNLFSAAFARFINCRFPSSSFRIPTFSDPPVCSKCLLCNSNIRACACHSSVATSLTLDMASSTCSMAIFSCLLGLPLDLPSCSFIRFCAECRNRVSRAWSASRLLIRPLSVPISSRSSSIWSGRITPKSRESATAATIRSSISLKSIRFSASPGTKNMVVFTADACWRNWGSADGSDGSGTVSAWYWYNEIGVDICCGKSWGDGMVLARRCGGREGERPLSLPIGDVGNECVEKFAAVSVERERVDAVEGRRARSDSSPEMGSELSVMRCCDLSGREGGLEPEAIG
ncbi:hypothetical protein BC938DRAFT_473095 [Jimgerdemannia flammicorona]|uniref:Uncharacterized protein n=1 Tax=Jimgerdemannia flammicorona TaxID=994334 RepID=A0A433Q4W7_9FUNG|nr:hypothetical protein BC938DRAFT_473095 [Jimgerdemannia flammicorona]